MTELTSTQAFTAGADLWIAGNPENSTWALRIDWVLNFQILRASRHEKARMPAEILDFLQKSGLRSPVQNVSESDSLLIPADLNLPCRWVLTKSDWSVESLAEQWRQLGEPSLRVFLPKSVKADKFAKDWTAVAGSRDFQIVLE